MGSRCAAAGTGLANGEDEPRQRADAAQHSGGPLHDARPLLAQDLQGQQGQGHDVRQDLHLEVPWRAPDLPHQALGSTVQVEHSTHCCCPKKVLNAATICTKPVPWADQSAELASTEGFL